MAYLELSCQVALCNCVGKIGEEKREERREEGRRGERRRRGGEVQGM